ncbi:MAG: hypothetical protein VZQ98_04700 [Bacteroidales bacterium]|nr:hypothetical protein [Bacteroidales bacterium]
MKKIFILLFTQLALCCTSFAANYLTFTAEEDNSSFCIEDHNIKSNIFYSLDNGKTWNKLTDQPVKLAKGDRTLLKGGKPDEMPSWENYSNFKMAGTIAANGSVMSLVDGDGESKTIPYDDCFCRLFEDCSSLTKAPELPATTLATSCYSNMFYGCKSLIQAPELPATQLANSCYEGMFGGCTSLTKAPELPAQTLTNGCYEGMFSGCSKLAEIKVGFTDWGEKYRSVFEEEEIDLSAVVDEIDVPVAIEEDEHWSTSNWLENVAPKGKFICPKMLSKEFGENRIPQGWKVIKK